MMHHPTRTLAILSILILAAADSRAQIKVYFTRPVDHSLAIATDNRAAYESNISTVVADLIDHARTSVDMAMYNLNVARIVDALADASRRGVVVRVIGHVENIENPASRFSRLGDGIELFANPRVASGEQQPLMHNKFIVIDAEDWDPLVITGSWNATYAQTFDDANNVLVIRDSAVAGAYRKEFEEMWGSRSKSPNADAARFGAAKRDNTDHSFTLVDGTRIEVWFSPSDTVESHIRDAISTAETSLYCSNLTITSGALARRMKRQWSNGADVRSLIENIDDDGSQFEYLRSSIDARATASDSGLLHHKYAVVDAIPPGGGTDAMVVTGSHNWTYSASSINDENTVIIHSAAIANQFLQEFAARYREAGGTRSFGVASVDRDKATTNLPHPNPFDSELFLSTFAECDVDIALVNMLGIVVARGSVSRGERHVRFEGTLDAEGTLMLAYVDCSGTRHAYRVTRIR